MNTPTSFTCKFTLDKSHFNECYSQSSTVDRSINAYLKAVILIVFGFILLLFTPINAYAAWFVIALGILEALAIYYSQPWWVLRQMLSKSSGCEVTLTIDEKGVLSKSFYHNSRILWADVNDIDNTPLGFVLHFVAGNSKSKSYLSKACLSHSAEEYILTKKEKLG